MVSISLPDFLKQSALPPGAELLFDPVVWAPAAAGSVATALALALSPLVAKGKIDREAHPSVKAKVTRQVKSIIDRFKKQLGMKPNVDRKKDIGPLASHFRPDTNQVVVSYYGHPTILAHELGHASNAEQGRQSALGRMLQGATNVSYSPAPALSSLVGSAGFRMHSPEVGYAGVAGSGILGALQLIEEARASRKAMQMMQELRGRKEMQDILPLLGGFGTYAAGVGGMVVAPFLVQALTGNHS